MKVKINHPMADKISIIDNGYSGENSVEIAFFRKGEWVTDIIPEFADYADGQCGDTRVYGWVPSELVDEFLFYHEV